MQSFSSRAVNFVLRHRHLLQGRLKREEFTFNSSIEAFRDQCEKGADRYAKIPDRIKVKADEIEGIRSEWLTPDKAPENKIIIYVHGGGYVSGSCNDHRGFVSKFADITGITNLLYEYRLAPEHPFPAALDDSIKIYEWLLSSGYKNSDIILAGESAGGGLVLAILLYLKENSISFPCAAVSISPWTDLSCSSISYRTKNKVSLAPKNSWTVFSKYYVANNKADHPFISPLFGDLTGLPPIYINSGTDDELFEDGEKFYLKAKGAGVDITFKPGKGMVHCYPLLSPMFREATEAMNEIVGFIKMHMALDGK